MEDKAAVREAMVEALNGKGYRAEPYTAVKNGVAFDGIAFHDGDIGTVIYTDDIIRDSGTPEEAVGRVLELHGRASGADLGFSMDDLRSPAYMLGHMYIGLQKEGGSSTDIVRADTWMDGIERYLYARVGDGHVVKLPRTMLEALGIAPGEAWEAAEANTFRETRIVSMAEMLADMGLPQAELPGGLPEPYILTNAGGSLGASAALDRQALRRMAAACGTERFAILPCSVHEMMAVPYDGSVSVDEYGKLVRRMGMTNPPEERLTGRAYTTHIPADAADGEADIKKEGGTVRAAT